MQLGTIQVSHYSILHFLHLDINECLTPEVNCFGDRCRNTPGSFNCVPCLPGFAVNDEGFCVGRNAQKQFCDTNFVVLDL